MQTEKYLQDYYQSYNENGRLQTRHGMVEFLTTMRYIERYLQPGMRVIEIGAGTGRYSHALAQKGYQVDAVELVAHNIEQFQADTLENEPVTIRQGNALDLSDFADNTYDITLLLGPMYHLYEQADQTKALSEAIRVTKPGGVIFVAYCMADPSIIDFAFRSGQIDFCIEQGLLDTETFAVTSRPEDLFELYRVEEITALREQFAVTPLHLVAADGYARHMKDTLAAMDNRTYQLYLDYHFATCERIELLGYSHHTLDIFRKE